MKKKRPEGKNLLYISLGIIFFISCTKNKNCVPGPDISGVSIELEIERVDQKLFAVQSKEELANLIDENPVFAEAFLMKSQYPHDSILINRYYGLLHDPSIDTLWRETQEVFGDFEDIKNEFSDAFKRIRHFYPDFRVPKIKTVFTGLSHDMYLSDSLIIIGLDYYLGNEGSFRPLNTPEYILKRYRKENIVPNTLLLISERYNQTNPRDLSLLADMIYYGKAHYFSKQMLPCVPDSIFLGYTPEEISLIDQNEGIIWANFIENELLYETSHFMKDKFISERPTTLEISENCPGRIGRWVGWEMVKEYHNKNKDISFTQLMRNPDAQDIFVKSRYKPRI